MNTISNPGINNMAGFTGGYSMGDTSTYPNRRFPRAKLNVSSGSTSALDGMLSRVE